MKTVKIPMNKNIQKQLSGKVVIETIIKSNGEIELEVEECQLFNRLEKLNQEIKNGKGIKMDMNSLAKELQL
jgi:hypothetical protein